MTRFLVAVVVVAAAPNPFSMWCDYHTTYFHKTGVEYPAGKCYDVYTHPYYDAQAQKTLTHKATMACAK